MAKNAGHKRDGNGDDGGRTSAREHANKNKKIKRSGKSTSGEMVVMDLTDMVMPPPQP